MTAHPRADARPDDRTETPPALGRRLEVALGVPFTTGNELQVLRNGVEIFPALLEAVAASQRSIDLLWFLWGRGDVTEQMTAALVERARAGVRVRVLLDGFGARGIARQQLRRLRRAGCDVAFFHPLPTWRLTAINRRTHRRALVCDETVAFTAGAGLDEAWAGNAQDPSSWRDNGFRVRGPAVDGLRAAFLADWVQTPHPLTTAVDQFPVQPCSGGVALQVFAPSSRPGWNSSAVALLTLLEAAQSRVRIVTPYTRLPRRFHAALGAAVQRGVQVQLLVSGPHVDRQSVAAQSRHDFGRLLEAGVEVWQYQPTLLHAKTVTVDGSLSLVGTTNLDIRSFALNEQVGLTADDPSLTALLDAHIDEDLSRSERLTPERWQRRGTGQRSVQATAAALGRPMRGLGAAGLTRSRPALGPLWRRR